MRFGSTMPAQGSSVALPGTGTPDLIRPEPMPGFQMMTWDISEVQLGRKDAVELHPIGEDEFLEGQDSRHKDSPVSRSKHKHKKNSK